jgi:hypothetical protein
MIDLSAVRAAWDTPEREAALKRALEGLDAADLPLQQALMRGSQVTAAPVQVMVLTTTETAEGLEARVGVFFTSLLGGCQCADDPTPLESLPEYAQIKVTIQRETGMARLRLLD